MGYIVFKEYIFWRVVPLQDHPMGMWADWMKLHLDVLPLDVVDAVTQILLGVAVEPILPRKISLCTTKWQRGG